MGEQLVERLLHLGLIRRRSAAAALNKYGRESPEAPSRVYRAPLCWRLLCLSSCGLPSYIDSAERIEAVPPLRG